MQIIHRSIASALLFCSACLPAVAQVPAPAADVTSVDAIVAALYDTISGPAGGVRDWVRLRSLFAPGGHLVSVHPDPDGGFAARNMALDDYIARAAPVFARTPFYEKEAARTSETFGQIAHVFSTYESRHAPGDAKPFQRGINSIELFSDGKRWWIVSLVWRAEDEKLPLPARYLHSGAQ
jgi:hypothetical protein